MVASRVNAHAVTFGIRSRGVPSPLRSTARLEEWTRQLSSVPGNPEICVPNHEGTVISVDGLGLKSIFQLLMNLPYLPLPDGSMRTRKVGAQLLILPWKTNLCPSSFTQACFTHTYRGITAKPLRARP